MRIRIQNFWPTQDCDRWTILVEMSLFRPLTQRGLLRRRTLELEDRDILVIISHQQLVDQLSISFKSREWKKKMECRGSFELHLVVRQLGKKGLARLEVDSRLLLPQPFAGEQEGCRSFHNVQII